MLAAASVALTISDGKGPDLDYQAWVRSLPACAPSAMVAARRPLPDDVEALARTKRAVVVRARLVPGLEDCTLMGCDSGCCNGCSFDWVVVPRKECPGWTFGVRHAGRNDRFRGGGLECEVSRFGALAAEVIVTGRLETSADRFFAGVIVAAEICRVDAGDPKRLTDADYARLMSPAPARPQTRACPHARPSPKPPESASP